MKIAALARRRFLGGAASVAALAAGKAPVFAQAAPKKLVWAHNVSQPESGAIAFAEMAEAVTEQTHGEIEVDFQGGTLITKELEVMNAVRAGNVAIGDPGGGAATVFPDMGAFLVPYLVSSYDHAYKMFNGDIGERLDKKFQQSSNVKVLFFFDYGFRHFWNNRRPIVEPKDLRGLKMRVQPSTVFADTINGLGGVAVPMAFAEVIPAAQQGVIDGADLPVINILNLKAYEVSKYASLTYHNYGPTCTTMNLNVWNGLTPAHQKLFLELGRAAQQRIRQLTETVDNFAKAKELLEPKGMVVNEANVAAFKKVAEEKVWPKYKQQFPELWEQIVAAKV